MLNEKKTLSPSEIREAWPGVAMEEVPAIRKEWGSAPRAGIATIVQPGLLYAVHRVYNEHEPRTNVVFQALTLDLPKGLRITGAYVSPNSSTKALTNLLSDVITDGTDRDWLIGDRNARQGLENNGERKGESDQEDVETDPT